MKFNLAYGKTGQIIELPDNLNADLIEPVWVKSVPDQSKAVSQALDKPYSSKPLQEIVNTNTQVGIIFSDITRATPYHIIIPELLTHLRHIPRENIRFFCANGTHRLVTDDELVKILGESVVRNYEIIQNESDNADLFEYVGTTSSGNEIFLNREILSCDIKILTGFIEPHFFAGFSGGGKALIPGMASAKTIKFNHSIRQLSLEGVNWGITNGNPLWEEIIEAAEFVPGLFLLNITLNKNKEITGVFAGELRTAHKTGCQFVKESSMVPVDKPYDIVITSNSGYPLDLNVYQTVKGMSAAAQIVKDSGHIIIAAECWDGIPSNSGYEAILKSVNSAGELMEFIMKNEKILQDTWQIYFQALIQEKATVHLYSKELDDEVIRSAFFEPVDDIADLIVELTGKIGPEAKICILPEGPQTIPYLK